MMTFVVVELNLILRRVDFSCIDENESVAIYMNMLDTDRIIELAEIGKKILLAKEDNYDYDDQIGRIHIGREMVTVKSYAWRFEESCLTTKHFVNALMKALLYYELIDNRDEFFETIVGENDFVDEAIGKEIKRRLSPDVEITRLRSHQ